MTRTTERGTTQTNEEAVKRTAPGFLAWLIPLGTFLLATGCTNIRTSHPKRTATEQLLLSTATDRALEGIELPHVDGKKVYLDTTYLEAEDENYVIGTLRDLLLRNGALIQDNSDQAEIVVEARSGALSTDSTESLGGIPSIPVPIPTTGTLETPEVPLFKASFQSSVAKLALTAYVKASGKHLFSADTLIGKARYNRYTLLGITKKFTTIPEKK